MFIALPHHLCFSNVSKSVPCASMSSSRLQPCLLHNSLFPKSSAPRRRNPLLHVSDILCSTSPKSSAPDSDIFCSTSPKSSAPRLCSTSLLIVSATHVSSWLQHCIFPIAVSHLSMFLVRPFTANNCKRVWYTLICTWWIMDIESISAAVSLDSRISQRNTFIFW